MVSSVGIRWFVVAIDAFDCRLGGGCWGWRGDRRFCRVGSRCGRGGRVMRKGVSW